MHDLFAYKQGARNIADNQARQVGEMVRLASFEGESKSKPARKRADLVDRSIAAVLAARVKDKEGNVSVSQNAFDNFLLPYVEAGRSKGLRLMESPNPKWWTWRLSTRKKSNLPGTIGMNPTCKLRCSLSNWALNAIGKQ
jgi:hypothetical protein